MCNLYFGSGVLKKDPDVLAVDPKLVFNLYNNYLLRSVFLYFCTFGIKIDHCVAVKSYSFVLSSQYPLVLFVYRDF